MHAMNRILAATAVAIVSAMGTSDAIAADGPIRIEGAWSRAMPPVAKNGAAYMAIHNQGESADRLLGGETPAASRVEVHTHVMKDGMMKMTHLEDGIELPPGGTQQLAPGGLHLMLMGLRQPLVSGNTFQVTLTFAEAPPLSVEVLVKDAGTTTTAGHGQTGGMHDMKKGMKGGGQGGDQGSN